MLPITIPIDSEQNLTNLPSFKCHHLDMDQAILNFSF